MNVKLTLIEPMLATSPGSKELVADFVAGKIFDSLPAAQRRALYSTPEERKALIQKVTEGEELDVKNIPDLADDIRDKFKEELAAIEAVGDIEKMSTVYPRDNGHVFLWDYQLRGFLKAAHDAQLIAEVYKKKDLKDVNLTRYSYKRTIDKTIFVFPRKCFIELPNGCDVDHLEFLERSLRVMTMKGERNCLARSEVVPAGSIIKAEIRILNKKHEGYVFDWLDYGELSGLLQWRSGSFGRFTWDEV